MNLLKPNPGIRARILFLALVPLLLVVAIVGYYQTNARIEDLNSALQQRGQSIATHLAPACEFGLFSNNTGMLQDLAKASLQEPDIAYIRIFDSADRLVASAQNDNLSDASAGDFRFSAPILATGIDTATYDAPGRATVTRVTLGSIEVGISSQPTRERQNQVLVNSLLLLATGLLVSLLLALIMLRGITTPILHLNQMMKRITEGDLSARVPQTSTAELGNLESGFNEMAARIEGEQDQLEKEVANATAELNRTVDILKKKNIELSEARTLAVRASEAKAEFLARMSHEIRTPLNAVIGFSRLLESTGSEETRAEYIEYINNAAEQLLSVIDSILRYSKLESGAVELEEKSYNLHSNLENTMAMLSDSAHRKGLELVLLMDPDVPQQVYGDAMHVNQILTNLLANAIKFTEQGHVILKVRMNHDHAPPRLEFAVIDSGIGIEPNRQNELFRPFSQIDSTISRRFGGTGLGLQISRMLARLMKGEIHVQSATGMGSTFTLTIPCPPGTGIDPTAASEPPIACKALLYDSHPQSRLAIYNTLRSWDMNISVAESADDIIYMLGKQNASLPWQLLIVSVQRDEADDRELQTLIITVRETFQVPVLLLVGADHWEMPFQPDRGSAIEWMPKPARRQKLRKNICQLLALPCDIAQDTEGTPQPDIPADLHILVVEDNQFNQRLFQSLLRQLGARITLAQNGEQTLEHIRETRFDLIFMDIHMPEMDGLEVARRVRDMNNPNQDVPIIGLTADVLMETDDTETTINGYCYKPIGRAKLAAIIDKWTPAPEVKANPPE